MRPSRFPTRTCSGLSPDRSNLFNFSANSLSSFKRRLPLIGGGDAHDNRTSNCNHSDFARSGLLTYGGDRTWRRRLGRLTGHLNRRIAKNESLSKLVLLCLYKNDGATEKLCNRNPLCKISIKYGVGNPYLNLLALVALNDIRPRCEKSITEYVANIDQDAPLGLAPLGPGRRLGTSAPQFPQRASASPYPLV